MLFLAICTSFEFLCILLYAFFFPKLPIVKYFRSKAASEGSKTVSADLAAAGIQTKAAQVLFYLTSTYMLLVWECFLQCQSCLRIFFAIPILLITLAVLQAEDEAKQYERLSNKQLFIQNFDYALDLFLIYVLTLSIFPGFLYENTGQHRLGEW